MHLVYVVCVTHDQFPHLLSLITGAKVEECECAQCCTKGWEGIKTLGLKLLKELGGLQIWQCDKKQSQEALQALKIRLLKAWDFLRTQLASHMRKKSNVASHCLNWLLSSRSDKRLACQCTHAVLSSELPDKYAGAYDTTCSGSKCDGADGTISGGKRLSSSFYACLYCSKISCPKCIRTMWGQSEQLGKTERAQRHFVCRSCSSLLAKKRHEMSCDECNEVEFLKLDLRHAASFVETSSCDENSKKRIRVMTDRVCRNIDLFIGHVARDKIQNLFWPEKLQQWARDGQYDSMLILSDFWQLFAGTYERRVGCDTGDKQSVETHVIWSVCPPLHKLDTEDLVNLSAGQSGRWGFNEYQSTLNHSHHTPTIMFTDTIERLKRGETVFLVTTYHQFCDLTAQSAHQAFCNFLSLLEAHKARFKWIDKAFRYIIHTINIFIRMVTHINTHRQTDNCYTYECKKVCVSCR